MTQRAIVKQVTSETTALISIVRQTECALNCDSCQGCPQKQAHELLATADISSISVQVGDVVEVASNSMGALLASVLVFAFPCLGFIAGYLVAILSGAGSVVSILTSFVGALICFLPALFFNAKAAKRDLAEFNVIRILR